MTITKRWFFWYLRRSGDTSWSVMPAQWLTDAEAFQAEFATRHRYLGAELYRLVYEPRVSSSWIWDPRNDRQLLAGQPIPGAYA